MKKGSAGQGLGMGLVTAVCCEAHRQWALPAVFSRAVTLSRFISPRLFPSWQQRGADAARRSCSRTSRRRPKSRAVPTGVPYFMAMPKLASSLVQ